MKWIVLILIIIVILIAFALWRRMQAAADSARSSQPPHPAERPSITPAVTDDPTPATEAGVDEGSPAPASESPPAAQPPPAQPPPAQSTGHPEDWWPDQDQRPRD